MKKFMAICGSIGLAVCAAPMAFATGDPDIDSTVLDTLHTAATKATTYLTAAILVAAVFVLFKLAKRSISKV